MINSPKILPTIELIKQQALEISRLSYLNHKRESELFDTYHPEFGKVPELKGIISDLVSIVIKMKNVYRVGCFHKTPFTECINCRITEVLKKAQVC